MGRPAVLKVEIVADAKGVGPGVAEADSKFGKLGSSVGKVGKAVGVGMAAAGVAVGAFAVASVKSASDTQQAFGAVDSVFGKNAKQVKAWAGGAAKSVGLAKSEYANLAALVGAQLGNMGRSTSQAAKQSNELVKMGADLAATFGGTTKEAVEALSSPLKGETDPIERYGISIKQSDINARLAAEGQDKLTGTALKQATATATLALVTEQGAKAHGAFARESDTLAHQQQILGAQFEYVKSTVGTALLPILTKLGAWVNDRLIPGATVLGRELATKFGPTVKAVGGFISGTLVPAISSLFGWLMNKIVPAITSGVSPILRGLQSLFGSVGRSIQGNSDNLSKLGHFLAVVLPPAIKVISVVLGTTLRVAFTVIGKVIGGVITVIATLVGWIASAISKLTALGKAIANSPIGKAGGVLAHIGFGARYDALGQRSLMAGPGAFMGQGGRLAGPGRFGWGQFAGGSSSGLPGALRAAQGGLTVIDRRTIDARLVVEGDVLDPVGTARMLDRVSREHATRIGRAATFGSVG
jgi:hypothetical protein